MTDKEIISDFRRKVKSLLGQIEALDACCSAQKDKIVDLIHECEKLQREKHDRTFCVNDGVGFDDYERESCDCYFCLKEDRKSLLEREQELEAEIKKQKDVIHKLIIEKVDKGVELSPYFENIRNMYSNDLRDAEERFSKAKAVYEKKAADERNKNALLEAEVRLWKKRFEKERGLPLVPKPPLGNKRGKELLLFEKIYKDANYCQCNCCWKVVEILDDEDIK